MSFICKEITRRWFNRSPKILSLKMPLPPTSNKERASIISQ